MGMSVTITRALDLVFYTLIVLLLMKLIIDPREFYFNAALRPVHLLTDPILQFIKRVCSLNRMGTDLTPLIAIVALTLVYFIVSVFVMPEGIILSFKTIFQNLVMFFIRLYTFSIFVLVMIPGHSRNPVTGFFHKLVLPFKKLFSRTKSKLILAGVFLLVLALGTVANALIESIGAPGFSEYLTTPKNLMLAAIEVGIQALSIYRFIILLLIVAVILSWLSLETHNVFVNMVFLLTEPILIPVRRLIPPVGGLDLSPWVASLCLWIIGSTFTSILMNLRIYLV